MTKLTPQDFEAVKRAVAEVELKTRGEIVPLVLNAATDYGWVRYRTAVIGTATAMVAGEVLSKWRSWPLDVRELTWLIIGGGLLGAALGSIPIFARWAIGRTRIARDVHRRALAEFTARGCGHTREHTGILIMVALSERRIEIISDRGIHGVTLEKDGAAVWDKLTAEFAAAARMGQAVQGLISVIHSVGALLAKHFPPDGLAGNELSNELQTGEE